MHPVHWTKSATLLWLSLWGASLNTRGNGESAETRDDNATQGYLDFAQSIYRDQIAKRNSRLSSAFGGDVDRLRPWQFNQWLWDWFPPAFNCPSRQRLGVISDGGKVVCNLEYLNSLGPDCVVFSFGVRDEDSFERDLVAHTQCRVYAFDPTVDALPSGSRTEVSCDTWPEAGGLVEFRKLGLAAQLGRAAVSSHTGVRIAQVKDMETLMESLGIQRIHLLKVDIEGSEWDVFNSARAGQWLQKVDQLQIELHFKQKDTNNAGPNSGVREVFRFFQTMEQQRLFPFSWELNFHPPAWQGRKPFCIEYSFVRPETSVTSLSPRSVPRCVPTKRIPSISPYRVDAMTSAEVPLQRIPRVIRQTHKPSNFSSLPSNLRALAMTWREKNPTYAYEYYSNEAMEAFVETHGHRFTNFKAAFRKATSGTMRADLWRYLITWINGGVYADMDTRALKPLPIVPKDRALSGCGHKAHLPEQFVLAYEPRHPLLFRALEMAVANVLESDPGALVGREIFVTGPVVLGHAATEIFGLGRFNPRNCSRFHGVWKDEKNTTSIRILNGTYDCVGIFCGHLNSFGGTVSSKAIPETEYIETLQDMNLTYYMRMRPRERQRSAEPRTAGMSEDGSQEVSTPIRSPVHRNGEPRQRQKNVGQSDASRPRVQTQPKIFFLHLSSSGGTSMCQSAHDAGFNVYGHRNCNPPVRMMYVFASTAFSSQLSLPGLSRREPYSRPGWQTWRCGVPNFVTSIQAI